MNFMHFDELVWRNVLLYLGNDPTTLSRLSSTCKDLLAFTRLREYWIYYYKTYLQIPVLVKSENSEHIGPQTYFLCKLGIYPGWRHIHEEIPTSIFTCTNLSHYTNLKKFIPDIRHSNMFQACARRRFVLEKQRLGIKWTKRDQRKLTEFQKHVRTLKEKKKRARDLYTKYYVHLTSTQKRVFRTAHEFIISD